MCREKGGAAITDRAHQPDPLAELRLYPIAAAHGLSPAQVFFTPAEQEILSLSS